MSLSSWLHFLRWLREELVRALLWPAYWRAVALDTPLARRRFDGLVAKADCWPCRVSYGYGNPVYLYITSESDALDFGDEEAFA